MQFGYINNLSTQLTAPLGGTVNDVILEIEEGTAEVEEALLTNNNVALTLFSKDRLGLDIKREVVHAVSVSGGQITVKRAQEGTEALQFFAGEYAEARLTKEALGPFYDIGQYTGTLILANENAPESNYDSPDSIIVGNGHVVTNGTFYSSGNNVVIGLTNIVYGSSNVAIGRENDLDANTAYATVLGYKNSVNSNRISAVSIGSENSANGSSSGLGSIAIGVQNTAGGNASVAMGAYCEATAFDLNYSSAAASAVGRGCKALAVNSAAAGMGATASGEGSAAFGSIGDLTFGEGTTASGKESAAFGVESVASGDNSLAVGYKATTSGLRSLAVGQEVSATGSSAVSIGDSASAAGAESVALGLNANAANNQATVIGAESSASAEGGTAVGYNAIAGAESSVALGQYSECVGKASVASGIYAFAFGSYSLAFGHSAYTDDTGAIAVGHNAFAYRKGGIIINALPYLYHFPAEYDWFSTQEGIPNVSTRASSYSVLQTEEIDLTNGASSAAIEIPSGISFFVDRVDVIVTAANGASGSPEFQVGESDTNASSIMSPTVVTKSAKGQRQKVSSTFDDEVNAIYVSLNATGTGTEYKAKLIFHGYALETTAPF